MSGTDPEPLHWLRLAGGDSSKFTIDENGVVKISGTLDYETNPTYDFTVNVSDSAHTSAHSVSVTVTNINEAPTGSFNGASSLLKTSVSVRPLPPSTPPTR